MTPATELLRQIHPAFVHNGEVTSQPFRPTAAHDAMLSFYDGDQISPKAAWEHFISDTDMESVGVLAVTVSECTTVGLTAVSSPKVFP